MAKYECKVCGYIFNESYSSSSFEEMYSCPICDADHSAFVKLDEEPEHPIGKISIEDDDTIFENPDVTISSETETAESVVEDGVEVVEETAEVEDRVEVAVDNAEAVADDVVEVAEENNLFENNAIKTEVPEASIVEENEEVKTEAPKTDDFVVERRQEFWTSDSATKETTADSDDNKTPEKRITGWGTGSIERVLDFSNPEQPEVHDVHVKEIEEPVKNSFIESFYANAKPVKTPEQLQREEEEKQKEEQRRFSNIGGGGVQTVITPTTEEKIEDEIENTVEEVMEPVIEETVEPVVEEVIETAEPVVEEVIETVEPVVEEQEERPVIGGSLFNNPVEESKETIWEPVVFTEASFAEENADTIADEVVEEVVEDNTANDDDAYNEFLNEITLDGDEDEDFEFVEAGNAAKAESPIPDFFTSTVEDFANFGKTEETFFDDSEVEVLEVEPGDYYEVKEEAVDEEPAVEDVVEVESFVEEVTAVEDVVEVENFEEEVTAVEDVVEPESFVEEVVTEEVSEPEIVEEVIATEEAEPDDFVFFEEIHSEEQEEVPMDDGETEAIVFEENIDDEAYITLDAQEEIKEEVPEMDAQEPFVFEEAVEEVVEAPVEEIIEEVVEAPVEEIVEEVAEAPVEEIIEEVVETPVEEIVEEVVETPVEENIEDVAEETTEEVVEEAPETSEEAVVVYSMVKGPTKYSILCDDEAKRMFEAFKLGDEKISNGLENIILLPAQLNPSPLAKNVRIDSQTVLGRFTKCPIDISQPFFFSKLFLWGEHVPGHSNEEDFSNSALILIKGEDGHIPNITSNEELRKEVNIARIQSDGTPVGVDLIAGRIEKDLEACVYAGVDFVILNDVTTRILPYALRRAKNYLNRVNSKIEIYVCLDALKDAQELAKILAMGADFVLVERGYDLDMVDKITADLKEIARSTGHRRVSEMNMTDICTIDSDLAANTDIDHV